MRSCAASPCSRCSRRPRRQAWSRSPNAGPRPLHHGSPPARHARRRAATCADPRTSRYRLGYRVLDLTGSLHGHRPAARGRAPHLQAIRDEIDETANLVDPEEDFAVYLEQGASASAVDEVGQRVTRPRVRRREGAAAAATSESGRPGSRCPRPWLLLLPSGVSAERGALVPMVAAVNASGAVHGPDEGPVDLAVTRGRGPPTALAASTPRSPTPARSRPIWQATRTRLRDRRRGVRGGGRLCRRAVFGHDGAAVAALSVSSPARAVAAAWHR